MPPTHPSTLLVEVSEAEPLVREHRMRFDPVTSSGVPAHVTALFPFVDRDALDATVLDRVAGVVAAHEPFDHVFSRTAWFDRDVLYLAPDDPTPFVGLTEHLAREFREHPPYAGEYDDVTPHLTVALRSEGADLDRVEAELGAGLPIAGRAERLTLMTEDDAGGWSVMRWFALGSGAGVR